MNKIIVIGNVGRDPEMRYTPNGNGVTSFSIASNRRYKTSSGEQRDETEWFNVSAWGKLADLCNQYLVKGKQVYLEGTLSSQRWEGQDGERRFSNNIICGKFSSWIGPKMLLMGVVPKAANQWTRSLIFHFRTTLKTQSKSQLHCTGLFYG